MDNDEFLRFLSQAQDHADEDIFLAQAAAVIILLAGIIQAKQRKIQQRNPSRLYLCRAQLLPDPRANTPWQKLWESQDDRAFITTMGIDVATFRLLLEGPNGFGESWSCTPIPRLDVSTMGQPRLGARSLDAAGALGMTLHYLGSAMLEVSLQQIFALIPSTVSRYLAFSKMILLARLRRMEEASIHLPRTPEEYAADSDLICVRHPLLEGAFGSIDGLSLPAQEAEDPEIENATYNGWKSSHCINNVLAFSPRGVIIDAALNAPGSWHDAHVARPIFERLRVQVPDGYFLVADTAFPRGTASIAGKIRAAMKGGERIPAEQRAQEEFLRFDRQLLSYRQTAEWGMRMMQGSFGRLRVPLPINDASARQQLLELCVRLANVRTNCVGLNEIRKVYFKTWKESEDERLWTNLGEMMFGDIRRHDRVSRFHVVVASDET